MSYFKQPPNRPISWDVAVISHSFHSFVLKPQTEVKTASLDVSSLPFSCESKSEEVPSPPLQVGFLTTEVYLINSASSCSPCHMSPSS